MIIMNIEATEALDAGEKTQLPQHYVHQHFLLRVCCGMCHDPEFLQHRNKKLDRNCSLDQCPNLWPRSPRPPVERQDGGTVSR